MNKNVLYISYNGLLEPILPSQAVPYLKILSKNGYRFILLTFEKTKDLGKTGKQGLRNIENDLEKYGITWRYLKYHKYPSKISTFLDIIIGFFSAIRILVKCKISIVHVRGATPGVIGLILSRFFRFKLLFDMRGLLAEEYVGGGHWREESLLFKAVKSVEEKLLKRADAVVLLTEKHYENIIRLPYLKNRNLPISVIPCCVDTERFIYNAYNRREILHRYNITADKLFIYPGKLGSWYLVKEMIDFFDCAYEIKNDLDFLILTQDDVNELNNARIHIIHPLFEEMPSFLNCADAGIFFINPYEKYGSSPIKLGEFLACGKPVIINAGIGDTEELVSANRVGVVVKNFNREEYLDKIKELFELLKEGDELANRCRVVAERFLSLKMGADSYQKIYNELTK